MTATITEAQVVAIYRETVDALYGYVSRRCGGERQLAEDVTQETWLRAVREWRRTGLPDKPLAWLTTVARNLLLNHFRRQQPLAIDAVPAAALLDAIDAIDAIDGEDAIDSAKMAALLHAALDRLPRHEALLIEQFHFERHRVAQLAVLHDTTERAIEGRLRRARERLRHELETTLPRAEGGIA